MNQAIEQETNQALSAPRTFPFQGTNLYRVLCDAQYRQSFHGQLKRYNPLVVALYKTGLTNLFGFNRTVMLLTTRGRKSGKLRSTPIGYWRIGGLIYLFSAWGKSASWYRNMRACPQDISIQIGLHRWPVQAQELTDPEEIKRTIAQFVSESPANARYLFGWDPECDRMENADFSLVIDRVVIVRFTEKRRGKK